MFPTHKSGFELVNCEEEEEEEKRIKEKGKWNYSSLIATDPFFYPGEKKRKEKVQDKMKSAQINPFSSLFSLFFELEFCLYYQHKILFLFLSRLILCRHLDVLASPFSILHSQFIILIHSFILHSLISRQRDRRKGRRILCVLFHKMCVRILIINISFFILLSWINLDRGKLDKSTLFSNFCSCFVFCALCFG